MEDKIYIFGHKNPDTDSVCSAIALSYLENVLGLNTEPRILSSINEETKYVLKRFKIEEPLILNDVKLQIKDVSYHKDFKININDSVYNAFIKMYKDNMSSIPLVDDNNKFCGIFAMKDIANEEIHFNITNIETNYNILLDTIKGKELLKFDKEFKIDLQTINKIVINNSEDINVNNKLLIITDGFIPKDDTLMLLKNNRCNVITSKKTIFEVKNLIKFSSYIKNYNYNKEIMCINENTEVTDFNDIIMKTKYSYYPVVDNYNNSLGLIKLSDLKDTLPKKVMLVDHNELSQSVEGLEESEIVAIFDHHKLGNLGTTNPINFRNMIVGSTCTIIYELYKENKVKVPAHIASLLAAGIISDTLNLKSPTTDNIDRRALPELTKIAGINANRLALEMFKANDIASSRSIKENIYNDFKEYNIEKKSIGIGVITTLNSKAILKQKDSYIKQLNKESKIKNYDLLLVVVTDIYKNGSYLLYNSSADKIMKYSFGDNFNEGDFVDSLISRKKQIIPAIMGYLI